MDRGKWGNGETTTGILPVGANSRYATGRVTLLSHGTRLTLSSCGHFILSSPITDKPVRSERSLDGKLFVEFVALIILSDVKKHVQGAKLFHRHTIQGLMDELDVIESLEVLGKEPIFGGVLERQTKLYEAMDVTPSKTATLCVSEI